MDRVRERTVEVGKFRCRLYEIVPGVPGTTLELEAALHRLDPSVVACDVDLRDVLLYRRHNAKRTHAPLPFACQLARRELDVRGDETETQNPYQVAADHARRRNVAFVPLAPEAARPGFFARRRLAREFETAVRAAIKREPDLAPAGVAAVWPQAARRDAAYAPVFKQEEAEIWRRLRDLLEREQAVRVAVVLRAPRMDAIAGRLESEALPREARGGAVALETAALEPSEVGKGLR